MSSAQGINLGMINPGPGMGATLKPKSMVDPEKAWKTAQDFEVTFTSHLVQQLFSENKTGLFGGGQTELMFRSFWAEKVAESMPGTFGIAESVLPFLLKDQEHA